MGLFRSQWDDPATERQKSYARNLGIPFPPDITKGEISDLIGNATGHHIRTQGGGCTGVLGCLLVAVVSPILLVMFFAGAPAPPAPAPPAPAPPAPVRPVAVPVAHSAPTNETRDQASESDEPQEAAPAEPDDPVTEKSDEQTSASESPEPTTERERDPDEVLRQTRKAQTRIHLTKELLNHRKADISQTRWMLEVLEEIPDTPEAAEATELLKRLPTE